MSCGDDEENEVAIGIEKAVPVFEDLLFLQVLFCFEQFDELTLLHLREFDRKKLISAETDIVVDHYKEEKFQDSKPGKTKHQQIDDKSE